MPVFAARRGVGARLVVAVAALVALGLLALSFTGTSAHAVAPGSSSTSGNAYPPQAPCIVSVVASNGNPVTSFTPGQTLTVHGSGLTPNASATITLSPSTSLGTATADANGDVSVSVTIPSNVSSGSHLLVIGMPSVTCQLSTSVASTPSSPSPTDPTPSSSTQSGGLAFTGPSSSTQSGGLAFTGFPTLTALAVVVLLVGGGIAFLVVGRRRSGTH